MTLHPQFITDTKGKVVSAILPINEFKNILEELEDLEDVRLYDEAKKMMMVNKSYFLST